MNKKFATRSVMVGLCGLCLALAGCSGSSSSSGGRGGGNATHGVSQAAQHHGAVDTCTLITQAEATKALGESAAPGKHDPDSDSPTDCDWFATDIDHFTTFVSVDTSAVANFDDAYNHAKDKAKLGIVDTAVSGLGDEAFTEADNGDPSHVGLIDVLEVKKGDTVLTFHVSNPSMTKAQAFTGAKVLAQAALGRL